MTEQVNDKHSQPVYNDCVNMTCSDDDKNILEIHADNSNNCIDYSLCNDDVPSHQSYGSINTIQHGDQDIINHIIIQDIINHHFQLTLVLFIYQILLGNSRTRDILLVWSYLIYRKLLIQ